ncbi:putative E3 ubiquitin-protein ligase ARI5, partial [Cucurbita argyrosperma subsp. argyrosperma]
MAVDASSSHGSSLSVDDIYFSVLHEHQSVFPISDEIFAEELQLQESIASSLFTSTIMSNKPSPNSESSGSTTLCTICTDTKSASEMFTSTGCSHTFCADCISKHIAAKLEDSMAVKCPEPKCAAVLEPEMCDSFVPKEVLERWGDALLKAMLLKWKMVYCPFKDCSAGMVDEEDMEAVECPECWRMFCAKCGVGWHGDMNCTEFQRLLKNGGVDREEEMTMKLADERKWKRCPHCKILVEKIEGADRNFATAVELSGMATMHVRPQLMNVQSIDVDLHPPVVLN